MRGSILAPRQFVRLLILIGVIFALMSLNTSAQSDSVWYPNRAQIYVNPGLISMTQGVIGVVFDSTECLYCKQNYPAWRFLGDLKADSLVYEDSIVEITLESQMASLQIPSVSLREKLESFGTYKLARIFPDLTQDDSLYWDEPGQRWVALPDFTRYFAISYDNDIAVDSVIDSLYAVAGVYEASGYPLSYEASLLNQDCPKRYIGGTTGTNHRWHFESYDDAAGMHGANTYCAWDLIDNGETYSVGVAFVDGNFPDTLHEDLDGLVITRHNQDTVTWFSSHATKSIGILAMNPYNNLGSAGVVAANLTKAKFYGYTDPSYNQSKQTANVLAVIDHLGYDYHPSEVIVFTDPLLGADIGLKAALEMAASRRIIAVASAGNTEWNGPPHVQYPGAWDDLVISVGNQRFDGSRHPTSNWTANGAPQQVDILAPGEAIYSPETGGDLTPDGDGYSHSYTGTSASAPIAAGIVALGKAVYHNMHRDQAEAWLKGTANKEDWTEADIPKWGWGRVDAASFVAEALNAATEE